MARLIVFVRGVNLAGRNRVAMAELREALEESGFEDVNTYLQSGNVVLSSKAAPKEAGSDVAWVIQDRFGLDPRLSCARAPSWPPSSSAIRSGRSR